MEWLKLNEDGEIEFNSEEVKLVPEVQTLLTLKYNKGPKDNDGRKRYRALAELKYLYLNYSPKSPYKDYSEAERKEEAMKDCNFPEGWVESSELKALIPKFERGQKTKFVRLLNTAERFLDKMEAHLNSLNLGERKDDGTYINKPKEIIDSLKQLPSLAQTLQELEQQVKMGQIGNPKSKGDHELGWMAMDNAVTKNKTKEEDEDLNVD